MRPPAKERYADLPPVASKVDRALVQICESFDWLRDVTPVDSENLWKAFAGSGYREVPEFRYRAPRIDIAAARRRLRRLPVAEVEDPLIKALLSEKKREVDRQLQLVELRGTNGFLQVSIDLFGDADPELHAEALHILEQVRAERGALGGMVGLTEVTEAARSQIAWYRRKCPEFAARIRHTDDLVAGLMVSRGRLLISEDVRIPRERIDALLHHEIGTHLLTWHNGSRQPLKQLQSGLAHYDELQEGLGVLSEYLAGNLSALRLRTLAARVVAVRMLTDGAAFPEVFAALNGDCGFGKRAAFVIATRVFRGGGLTKDVVYLRGLRDLLGYLREGYPFEMLFLGKFALSQLSTLEKLRKHDRLRPPELLPAYLHNAAAQQRLAQCGRVPVDHLYQRLVA